jgi:hypothetical protein
MIIARGAYMTAAVVPVSASPAARRGRAIGAFTRALAIRTASAVRRGAANALGAAGLVTISVGAGLIYLPAGLIVGGALAVWFASLLPSSST